MNRFRTLCFLVVSMLAGLPAAFGAQETIDFEGLAEGAVVDRVFSREASGPILIEGSSERFSRGRNAALIYDTACPEAGTPADCSGRDSDLGTPNEGFGGPGRGAEGGPSGRFPNSVALGKVLVVAESLDDVDGDGIIDDPDDEGALRLNRLSLDFSEIGTVTVYRLSLLDVNFSGEPSAIDLLDAEGNMLGASPFLLPSTHNNGVILDFDLGNTEGVTEMVVWLRGPGAIDNIVFSPEGPRVEIETLTNGSQADGVSDEDIPWIRVGQPVSWTYQVTNVGTVPLIDVTVTDDGGVEVDCPREDLGPGESMECSASGVSLDLLKADLGIPTAKGQCLSRGGRPLYQNTGSVSASGSSGGVVADSDPSHYCADPARPDLYVRKQKKGPDAQSVAAGSDASFKIVVWNRGTEDLRDIKVADVLSPDCNREFSRLAAGKSVSYTCSEPSLSIDKVSGCSLVNEIVATGRGDSETVTDSDTSTVELVSLTIEATFAAASAEAADLEITVTNNGCDLDQVTVTDALAPECERDLGALGAGESRNYACASPRDNEVCAAARRGDTEFTSCAAAAVAASAEPADEAPAEEGLAGDGQGDGSSVGDSSGSGGSEEPGGTGRSPGLLVLLLVVLVGGGLFAWNRMKAG